MDKSSFMRRLRLATATILALGVPACSRSPVGPTARSTPPDSRMARMSGRVRDGSDRTVAQARIQNDVELLREFKHVARDVLGVTRAHAVSS